MTRALTPIPARIRDLKGDVGQVAPDDGESLTWEASTARWIPSARLAPDGNGSQLTGLTQSQIQGLSAALATKAPLESPTLTGTPTAPTATAGTSTTQLATTAFVSAGLTLKADDSGVVHKAGAETITGPKTVVVPLGTTVPFTIQGTSDQASNLQDWKASTGVAFASVVALAPARFAFRAGGTAWLQIGANGSNFPQLTSSANGILIDTSNQSSGYANVTVLTNSAYGLRLGSGQSNVQASSDGRFYVETLAAGNYGIVIRGFANQSKPYLELRDSTGAPIAGFDESVNLRAKQFATYATSLAAPTVVANSAEFGSFNLSNAEGSGTLLLVLNINGSGYAQTKLYLISTTWAASATWKILRPITSSGPYSGNDCELDAIQSAGSISLRVRRTAGSTAATAAFSAVVLSRVYAPFTATGTTASVTPPTDYFLGGQTGSVPGNFDIGGWARVGHIADADAPNDSDYFSTTQGKRVYKDASGVVHTLY